jgi:hypothetical protein
MSLTQEVEASADTTALENASSISLSLNFSQDYIKEC